MIDLDTILAAHDAERQAELRAETVRRVLLATSCESDALAQAVAKEVCRRDVKTFFNDWLWTYDPRNINRGLPTDVPFVLRPRQADFLDWLDERERRRSSGLVEKSRDEGASFVALGYALHHWLFVDGFAAAFGSRKEELVDKIGDPKTLFWKLRFMLYRLPAWMLPAGFSRKEHDNFLRLINPATGASIAGEAGDNMGRGGRASLYFVDEWAHVARAQDVNAAISQNSEVRIKIFTPNGVGNIAYQERMNGRLPVFTFHWRDNPDKNFAVEGEDGRAVYPWYEKQVAELDPVTLAQEVDIDYTASATGTVIPSKWLQACVDFPLAEGSVRTSGLDVAEDESGDEMFYAHRRGGVVVRVAALAQKGPAARAVEAEHLAREDGAQVVYYDRLGVGSAITATLAARATEGLVPFRVEGAANSERPSNRLFEDQPGTPAAERFANRAAELWWALRLRAWRTYRRATGQASADEHPDDECLSIPLDSTLLAQLSQATYALNSSGKIVVNKKGTTGHSPDRGEAVMYAFADTRSEPQIFFV